MIHNPDIPVNSVDHLDQPLSIRIAELHRSLFQVLDIPTLSVDMAVKDMKAVARESMEAADICDVVDPGITDRQLIILADTLGGFQNWVSQAFDAEDPQL